MAVVLVVYDWLLCFSDEVTFIWKWRSLRGFNLSFLVYAFSRYGILIQMLLTVASNFPMSDLVSNLVTVFLFDGLIIGYVEVRTGNEMDMNSYRHRHAL